MYKSVSEWLYLCIYVYNHYKRGYDKLGNSKLTILMNKPLKNTKNSSAGDDSVAKVVDRQDLCSNPQSISRSRMWLLESESPIIGGTV